MIEFICYFLPGLFATAVAGAFVKKKYSLQSFLMTYASYTICINLGAFFYFMWTYGYVDVVFTKYMFTVAFSIEYLIVALIEATIFAVLFEVVRNNFRIALEVKKETKQKLPVDETAKGETDDEKNR